VIEGDAGVAEALLQKKFDHIFLPAVRRGKDRDEKRRRSI